MSSTIIIDGYSHIRYEPLSFNDVDPLERVIEWYNVLKSRRTVRDISSKPVSKEIIQHLIMSAGTAPSGANKQPWTFCAISNPDVKRKIRLAAEAEEKESYESRMSERWKSDLKPLATDWQKPFLEEAPWLIAVFKRIYEIDTSGTKHNNYYVSESVGIACGILITAIHQAGLVTVTHTPSPMNFLGSILDRPENERPFLLLPVGYPNEGSTVPAITKKDLLEISVFYE